MSHEEKSFPAITRALEVLRSRLGVVDNNTIRCEQSLRGHQPCRDLEQKDFCEVEYERIYSNVSTARLYALARECGQNYVKSTSSMHPSKCLNNMYLKRLIEGFQYIILRKAFSSWKSRIGHCANLTVPISYRAKLSVLKNKQNIIDKLGKGVLAKHLHAFHLKQKYFYLWLFSKFHHHHL